ncbi:hypothetical protein EJ07DRAFT_160556 [Lizonia empirigonia]|nr:hypothetical protein EJ07DRAFT_160556 [Lizonia empirigonia]
MTVAIPNKDSYVRIEGLRSGKVLAVKNEALCHADKEPVRAEHWWRIVPLAIALSSSWRENLRVEQVQDLIWNEDIAQEHSFEKSEGYEVGGEIGLKVSLVPELIETDVRVKTTTKKDWKMGQKNVETIKWGTNQHLAVPAGKTYIAQLTATKGTVTMPYTIKSTGKDSGAKSDVKGVYTGVQFYKIHTVVYDKEDPDAGWVVEDTGNSNRELRSYEPQGGEHDSEEKETYENQGYDDSRNFEDAMQQEGYSEEEKINQDSYDADDVEDTSSSSDTQTTNHQDEEDPRLGQAFDDSCNEYEIPQRYHGNALDEDNNTTDQLTKNDEPVSRHVNNPSVSR